MGQCFVCLFVGCVEEKMLLTYPGTIPIMLRRYIDVHFGILTSNKKQLEDLIQYVNDFQPSLSYSYDISDTSVTFLDISISMNHHGLTTTFTTKILITIHISDMNQLIHHLVKKYSLFTIS